MAFWNKHSFSYHVNLVKRNKIQSDSSSLCWSERWTFTEQTRTRQMQQIQQERHSLGTMWKCFSGRCYHTAVQSNTCFSFQCLEVFESTCSTLFSRVKKKKEDIICLRRSVRFRFTFTVCGNKHLGMIIINDRCVLRLFQTRENSSKRTSLIKVKFELTERMDLGPLSIWAS